MKYKVGDKIIAKSKSIGNNWTEDFDGGILTITDVNNHYYKCCKISHINRHYLEKDVVSAIPVDEINIQFDLIMDDII